MSLTDSSSALGWLHHSTFNPVENPMHDTVARRFARQMLSHNASLFAQHIPGNCNGIADSLSRDFNLSTAALTLHIKHTFRSQVPSNFQIYNLKKETICWIVSVLQKLTSKTELQRRQEKSRAVNSHAGKNSSEDAASMTYSSLPAQHRDEARSCVRSRTRLETIALARRLEIPFEAAQLKPPSQMWYRCSKRTSYLIPQQTLSAPEYSPFDDNCEDTKIRTSHQNDNAASL